MTLERFGDYLLLKRLGAGGGGDVFLARSLDRARAPATVVVKRIHADLLEREDVLRRFRHEAELASLIDDPHVARVHDAGVADGLLYIAMEYVAGWPLSRVITQLITAGKKAPAGAAVGVMTSALRGLAAIHGATRNGAPLGIIHRDVAPKNIMLRADGEACLIDLGIGRSNLQDWKTRTGMVMGSPGYMAPEHAMGKAIDHRTDLFAAAIVVWELLALRPYFQGETAHKRMLACARAAWVPLRAIRDDVPAALEAVLKRALARDPDERYQTAGELAAALQSALPEGESADATWLLGQMPGEELEREETEVRALLSASATAVRPELAYDTRPVGDPLATAPLEPPLGVPRATIMFAVGGLAAAIAAGVVLVRVLEERRPLEAYAPVPVAPAPVAPVKVTPAAVERTVQAVETAGAAEEQAERTEADPEGAAAELDDAESRVEVEDDPPARTRGEKARAAGKRAKADGARAEKTRPAAERARSSPAEAAPEERVQALIARARRLRARAGEDVRARVDDVLTSIMLARERLPQDPARLAALEAAVAELERGAR